MKNNLTLKALKSHLSDVHGVAIDDPISEWFDAERAWENFLEENPDYNSADEKEFVNGPVANTNSYNWSDNESDQKDDAHALQNSKSSHSYSSSDDSADSRSSSKSKKKRKTKKVSNVTTKVENDIEDLKNSWESMEKRVNTLNTESLERVYHMQNSLEKILNQGLIMWPA